MAKRTKKPIKAIPTFEWSCLIAALRYYQYGGTIASSSFPREVVEHYFAGDKYSDEAKRSLARQFYYVDHYNGEDDWKHDPNDIYDHCDREAWCTFYAFCKAYCEGFTRLKLADKKKKLREEHDCFWSTRSQRWYPVSRYLRNPYVTGYVDPKTIVDKELRNGPVEVKKEV